MRGMAWKQLGSESEKSIMKPHPMQKRNELPAFPVNAVGGSSQLSESEARQKSLTNRQLLYVLMAPSFAMILSGATFGVALPTIRTQLGIEADLAAWLVTAYTLPFIIFMPLYGRIGDSLGKRNLILLGMAIFSAGTLLSFAAESVPLLVLGRAVQGAGVAGIAPLSMAIISERFPRGKRGSALGTWNSVGPVVGIVGPLSAGLMVDYLGWRSIFLPMFLFGILAFLVVWHFIPSLRTANFRFLRSFDWAGVVLLASAITFFIFYISSRPITGVEPLRDWRLLIIALVCGFGFVWREKRRIDSFVDLTLLAIPSLRWASIGSGVRMFTMNGIAFVMPLYLADVRGLSAWGIGAVVMMNAAALLATMRLGGQLADRWGSRRPVMFGSSVQAACMAAFALLPADVPLALLALFIVFHGLGAGLSLAAYHRASLSQVDTDQAGAAAGIYSMVRFSGLLLGAALGGVLLQQSLASTGSVLLAYQIVFSVIAVVASTGIGVGWQLGSAESHSSR